MSEKHAFNPDWASHPSDTVRDCMEELGLCDVDLATMLDTTVHVATHVMDGHIPISGNMSRKLEGLGPPAWFWNQRQSDFDKRIAKLTTDYRANWETRL